MAVYEEREAAGEALSSSSSIAVLRLREPLLLVDFLADSQYTFFVICYNAGIYTVSILIS
jgi:hypothetical protein